MEHNLEVVIEADWFADVETMQVAGMMRQRNAFRRFTRINKRAMTHFMVATPLD